MMIDASLGRAGCSGYPQFPPAFPQPGPPFPQPPAPPVPVPPAEPDTLTVQLATAQTAIANGAAIPLTGTLRQSGNGLSYDAANRAVYVSEPGTYLFVWQILVQSAEAEGDVVVALQSLDGQTVLGYSGASAVPADGGTLISGTAAAFLPAGTSWALVNTSGTAVNIPVAGTAPAAFAAVLTVAEVGSSNTNTQIR